MACPEFRQLANTAMSIPLALAAQANMWKALGAAPWAREYVSDAGNKTLWIGSLTAASLIASAFVVKCVLHPKMVLFEFQHPVRSKFMCLFHITLLLLALSCPLEYAGHDQVWRRTVWVIGAVPQLAAGIMETSGWMFSENAHLGAARVPYLLTPIGWLVLCNLGLQAELKEAWGVDLPAMCFGVGTLTYVIVCISILQNLHTPEGRLDKGSAGLFLLVAPPGLASLSLASFTGGYGTTSTCAFGAAFFLQLVMMKISNQMHKPPPFMGVYWAYTLAPSVVATSAIRLASAQGSAFTRVLAVGCVAVATLLLLLVALRMAWHEMQVLRGREKWVDVLYAAYLKSQV